MKVQIIYGQVPYGCPMSREQAEKHLIHEGWTDDSANSTDHWKKEKGGSIHRVLLERIPETRPLSELP